ncbi:hypothetical protein HHK36_022490 [Tetracentron sinense]|uniref:RRM domain-containing protein n=1 Tax=Tetracentron sinense TaxID=13715 RepID=A0A835D653_TETSI|nr:hypothetical protein HHK36_022490 [Tetracentron sinense]
MDSNEGHKIFVGGISWWTPEDTLRKYFEDYGVVLEAVIIRDNFTGRSIGFVVFAHPSVLYRVLQDTHIIDGETRSIDYEKAMAAMISWFCEEIFNALSAEFDRGVSEPAKDLEA